MARWKSSSAVRGPVTSAAAARRSRWATVIRPSSWLTAAWVIRSSASVSLSRCRRAILRASSRSLMADRTSCRCRSAQATARNARARASGSRARRASSTSASAAGRNLSGSAATSSWARRARIKRPSGSSVLGKGRSRFPGKVRRPWVLPHVRRIGETVPFDENIKGDPFRGDYAGRADHEQWDDLEWQLHRQSAELAQRRFEPAIRHQLTQLQRRRRGSLLLAGRVPPARRVPPAARPATSPSSTSCPPQPVPTRCWPAATS